MKKATKSKLAVVKKPKDKMDAERNAMFAERVKGFTVDLQKAAAKFGINPEDLQVTVHVQIRDTPKKEK